MFKPYVCTATVLIRCCLLVHMLLVALAQVQKQDVELIAQQFDLDKKKAERCLREAKGDVKAALTQLLQV